MAFYYLEQNPKSPHNLISISVGVCFRAAEEEKEEEEKEVEERVESKILRGKPTRCRVAPGRRELLGWKGRRNSLSCGTRPARALGLEGEKEKEKEEEKRDTAPGDGLARRRLHAAGAALVRDSGACGRASGNVLFVSQNQPEDCNFGSINPPRFSPRPSPPPHSCAWGCGSHPERCHGAQQGLC